MMTLRPATARGHATFEWLDTYHSFSFGHYFDPRHMGFGPLRVINEDRIGPGGGFDTHGHSDMEIITYVLEGALEHRDSLGNGSVIRPGDVQRMSAGTGIRHSEFNASRDEAVHFLQIWIMPSSTGVQPGYAQTRFSEADKQGRLRLIASGDGRDGSVFIHQNTDVFAARLDEAERVKYTLGEERLGWLQVARGHIDINGIALSAGDGVAIRRERDLALGGRAAGSEVLLFDLPQLTHGH